MLSLFMNRFYLIPVSQGLAEASLSERTYLRRLQERGPKLSFSYF